MNRNEKAIEDIQSILWSLSQFQKELDNGYNPTTIEINLLEKFKNELSLLFDD